MAFNTIIGAITMDSSMTYYHVTKAITLEVDASQKGLGAALVQERKPIAFASKPLTKTQSNCSNIEREMLSLVHGVERFHAYLYGRSFRVITDHKPLEMSCNKPIASAPPRLQRTPVKIQGYDYSDKYRPGNEIIMSDVLSSLPNPSQRSEVQLDLRVDDLSLDLVNFSPTKQQELRDETSRCPILSALAEVVCQGWPDKMTDLPNDLRSFWSFRDELGIEDGVLFKGKQVMIPERMRGTILSKLHKGHQGIEKTRMLARKSVYWPRINDDIDKMTQACGVCQ